jgi:uncharacterized membrane protein
MEILVVFLFIILILLILSFQSRSLQRIGYLEEEIKRLQDTVNRQAAPTPSPAVPIAPPAAPAPHLPEAPIPPRPPKETEPFVPPWQTDTYKRHVQLTSAPPAAANTITEGPALPHAAPGREAHALTHAGADGPPKPPVAAATPATPDFFDRHPDMEKFIGENLISKIGIAILVLAIAFFVKYAIDNDWIGPVGRVGVGLLCGGILIGIAHFLRNSYKAFSSVLVGGGLAVFYFTVALAYHQYHLFDQAASFVIMLVITAFAVILSLLYDRQELAIIALVGGFLTPLLVSNGSGNYRVLFSYLMILNCGLLAISYKKAWRLLNLLAFIFTSLLFASWLVTLPYDAPHSTYQGGLLFATAFYILFFFLNLAHNIKENKKFIASDFGILLANTCLYFAAGLFLLSQIGLVQYKGLFTASMSAFNLLTSYLLFRKKKVDSNILYLLIGITLSFISLTAPLQLHGHIITLFWASESVLLYWLYLKSRIRLIGLASFLIWLAMLVSLLMDWAKIYGWGASISAAGASGDWQQALPVIFNKGFVTGLYSAFCCYALFLLYKRKERGEWEEGRAFLPISAFVFLLVGSIILLISGELEINHQFTAHFPGSNLNILYLSLYTLSFGSLIAFIASRLKWVSSYWHMACLLAACIIIYLISLPETFSLQRDMLEQSHYQVHFIAHWVSALVVAEILYRLMTWQRDGKLSSDPSAFTWVLCGLVVIFLSAELQLITNGIFYSRAHPLDVIQQVYFKTGLPILWGLCSFAFMWLGMHHKFKTLRILSLVLFSITLLKLFLFDIRDIPVAGKIAAFFCLGVLLLVVSFMYQRLKKIIIEDEEKKSI